MPEDALIGLEEHLAFHYSSESECDRAEAYALGFHYPERAWISTDRDVWHKNPYYKGPLMPHPEDDVEDIEAWRAAEVERRANPPKRMDYTLDDEVPF